MAAFALGDADANTTGRDEHSPFPGARIVSADLAPPEPGVIELRFREMFRIPVGPEGLEPSEKLLSLNGKRVRLIGYLVREEAPARGRLILAPLPVSAPDADDGPADDFPPQIVFVHLPADGPDSTMGWTPQLLAFTGTLEVGAREEVDGRVSTVRLAITE